MQIARRLKYLFIILLVTISAAGQNQSVLIDATEQKMVIDSVSKLLNDNYIFPDVAQKMHRLLQENLKKGNYKSITSAPGFAEQITKDLQSVSKDKHLNVRFNPKLIQQQRTNADKNPGEQPPPEMDNEKMNNYGFKEVKLLEGNIGYLDLRGFAHTSDAGETAVAAMNFLSNASALIIDLRNNGGGSPSMIQLLTSYFYGAEPVHLNNFYDRPGNQTSQTWTLPHVTGKRRPDIDIYVLTSSNTFSAAEEFTYNLKNLKRATIIGETTGGGAHPGGTRIATERFVVWVPTGRAINPITNTNWEGTGVKPDVETKASDALAIAHIKALETLVAKSKGALKSKYEWELVSLQGKKEPVQLDKTTLASYTGEFGEKKIVLEEGQLYFFPFPGTKVKLTPLSNNLFELADIKHVRLQVLKENNSVTGIVELFDNGSAEKHLRKVM
ncbi:MAG TPA: S41 family peptidase [Chitinophagaceae bacterium]|nr:S41 family peptidase [Chitinophagaceae bacterium]